MTDQNKRDSSSLPDDNRSAASNAERITVIDSADIFGEQREVLISHQGEVYRLRKTRQGKLILHK